ncbi:MAG: twin-arginine translocation signal domain-containing protein, partial [Betaproteobacteria bacterium]
MLIKIPRHNEPLASEITPREIALSRRGFLQGLAASSLAAAGWSAPAIATESSTRQRLPAQRNAKYSATDKPTAYADATTYNNFYEFGTDKGDPALYAGSLKPRPWTVRV